MRHSGNVGYRVITAFWKYEIATSSVDEAGQRPRVISQESPGCFPRLSIGKRVLANSHEKCSHYSIIILIPFDQIDSLQDNYNNNEQSR